MANPAKMKIIGFKDDTFKEIEKEIELQINPGSLKYTMGISYAKDERLGVSGQEKKFGKFDDSTLSFESVLDDTGLVSLGEKNISQVMDELDAVIYKLSGETHEPNYLQVSLGSFIYKGRMSSLSYDYTLFRPDGSPLRVKISMTVTGCMNKLYEAQVANRCSPDLSRVIVLKAGESLAAWCNEIYGDASYCIDVAGYNQLASFRNIPAGTKILFPPLIRS